MNESMIIADSAQIEARALAWLAGQDDLTQGFANNEDIYSTLAAELFKCHIHKPNETDPEPVAKLLKLRRGFGKDAILGAGYGMGADKFYSRCLENDALRPLFESGQYNLPFIKYIIDTYRSKYARIPKLWNTVEKCFKWVLKYPDKVMAYGSDFVSEGWVAKTLLTFWNEDGTAIIQLPSGRCLRYRHARLKRTLNRSEIRWHYGALWGGSLVENIIQAIARDLLGWWILEIEKQGIPIVLHVHDEVVCIVPDKDILLTSMIVEQIMKSVPEWAAGLPVDVEIATGKKYEK
ncbi:MAG TPA: hypothetical protein VMW50_08320 [Dehalococcoidia bacterium]|nr:hypothetical protein [Dehalococcoidia bacterium]